MPSTLDLVLSPVRTLTSVFAVTICGFATYFVVCAASALIVPAPTVVNANVNAKPAAATILVDFLFITLFIVISPLSAIFYFF